MNSSYQTKYFSTSSNLSILYKCKYHIYSSSSSILEYSVRATDLIYAFLEIYVKETSGYYSYKGNISNLYINTSVSVLPYTDLFIIVVTTNNSAHANFDASIKNSSSSNTNSSSTSSDGSNGYDDSDDDDGFKWKSGEDLLVFIILIVIGVLILSAVVFAVYCGWK